MIRLKELSNDYIIEQYNAGKSTHQIGRESGFKWQTINRRLHVLEKEGKVTLRNHSEQMHNRSQQMHARIREMLLAGVDEYTIAAEFNIQVATVTKQRGQMYNTGELERSQVVRRDGTKSERKRVYPTRIVKCGSHVIIPPTLEAGETVFCDRKVASRCVYGANRQAGYLCNYALITGKCRSLGEDGCDYTACTKFSKISKENPRIEYTEEA